MSGIEVVGLDAGIVSAFSSTASLYRDWRKRREERERQQANDNLEVMVNQGGRDVHEEYDQDFRRLGQVSGHSLPIKETLLTLRLHESTGIRTWR